MVLGRFCGELGSSEAASVGWMGFISGIISALAAAWLVELLSLAVGCWTGRVRTPEMAAAAGLNQSLGLFGCLLVFITTDQVSVGGQPTLGGGLAWRGVDSAYSVRIFWSALGGGNSFASNAFRFVAVRSSGGKVLTRWANLGLVVGLGALAARAGLHPARCLMWSTARLVWLPAI